MSLLVVPTLKAKAEVKKATPTEECSSRPSTPSMTTHSRTSRPCSPPSPTRGASVGFTPSRPSTPPGEPSHGKSFMSLQNDSCFDLEGRQRSRSSQGRSQSQPGSQRREGGKQRGSSSSSAAYLRHMRDRAMTTSNPGSLQRMANRAHVSMAAPGGFAWARDEELGCEQAARRSPRDASRNPWVPAPEYRRLPGLSWEDWKVEEEED